jgi:hypothetical protein
VKILQFDGERALGNRFKKICRKRGIQCQQTVPYTPEQNGPIERTGGVLIRKGRALIVDANLPKDLWPEAFSAAPHLLNRSPVRKLGWKAPFEVLMIMLRRKETKPFRSNLEYMFEKQIFQKRIRWNGLDILSAIKHLTFGKFGFRKRRMSLTLEIALLMNPSNTT